MDQRRVELSGLVVREHVDTGSKSERDAVLLKTDDGQTFTLSQSGATSFEDRSLDHLVGSSITARGLAIDQTLFMQEWKIDG